jgi:hypothetical protein
MDFHVLRAPWRSESVSLTMPRMSSNSDDGEPGVGRLQGKTGFGCGLRRGRFGIGAAVAIGDPATGVPSNGGPFNRISAGASMPTNKAAMPAHILSDPIVRRSLIYLLGVESRLEKTKLTCRACLCDLMSGKGLLTT